MVTADPARTAALVEQLISTDAAREMVPSDPSLSGRWHVHGVPSPYCRWNAHPEYEIHLITKGHGRFVVGDHVGTFSAGHLVLIGSYVPHHFVSDLLPGEHIADRDVVFQFHPDWLQRCREALPELGDLEPLLVKAERGIEFSGRTACEGGRRLRLIGAASGAERVQHIFALLAVMAAAPEGEQRLLARSYLPSGGDPRATALVDQVFGYVLEHLDDEVRLSVAAAHVGMSESALSKVFSRACGQTFTDTVRKLRLAEAGRLLRQTTLPVSVIHARVGYANLSNFNRQFRAVHKMTPTQYRREHALPA